MEHILALDAAVDAWARAARTEFLYGLAGWLTLLGDSVTLAVVVVVGALALWRTGRPRSALVLILAAFLGMILAEGLKEILLRPRPEFLASVWGPDRPSYAFPSGHSFNSASVYLTLTLLLGRRRWLAVAVPVVILVGLTRIYLGVHWLTDVLGGWAGGVAWALLWTWIDRRFASRVIPSPVAAPSPGPSSDPPPSALAASGEPAPPAPPGRR